MSGARNAGGQATHDGGADSFEAAHRALVRDHSVQFELRAPPKPPEPPRWLAELGDWLASVFRPVGRALAWVADLFPSAPYMQILLWTVLAVLAAAALWTVVERVRTGEWRRPRLPFRRRREVLALDADDGTPLFEAAPVRAWLREADALAAAGRFAEAVHLLLLRSIDDLAKRRPGLVRRALTSRELAAAPVLPPRARTLFAGIAASVERALFGGRTVDAEGWQAARADYAAFALPEAWRA